MWVCVGLLGLALFVYIVTDFQLYAIGVLAHQDKEFVVAVITRRGPDPETC